jgi:nucleotide-binding universal stress UspA family protein
MQEITTIVVPVDFQEHTETLVDYALNIANRFKANVCFCNVVEHLDFHAGYVHPSWDQMERDLLEQAKTRMTMLLDDCRNKLASSTCKGMAITGDIVDALIGYAKDEKADLIIIGTHGRRGLEKILLGSVAERVVKRSPCPILLFNPYTKD